MQFFKTAIAKVKDWYQRINRFLGFDVWHVNPDSLSSKLKARFVSDTKVVLMVLKTFKEQKIGFQSVALSYFSIMAVIPMIAVCFAVTSGFGLERKMLEILYSFNLPQDIVDMLMNGASNIIQTAQSGVFGLISALMFVWVIIWMMLRVERVFNNVWKVEKPKRKFYKSLGIDLIILILIPFVILIFSTGTIVYSHFLDLVFPKWIGVTDDVKSFLGWVIFAAVAVMTLSAMYKFIPATKVKYKHAFKAAILAGIAFTILQYLYLETQVLVMRLNAVYGAIAVVPLFMMWLRYGWLIIMYGAEFSYSFQKVEEHENWLEARQELEEDRYEDLEVD